MPTNARVIVAVPTLSGGEPLKECLAALGRQTFRSFEAVIVDNSGGTATVGLAGQGGLPEFACVVRAERNLGYGAAINLAMNGSASEFVAALNDDAVPSPEWLAALVKAAADGDSSHGMWASRVRLSETSLDSAGMLLYGDGSSKQRGHGRKPEEFEAADEVLLPSGSAALYRRKMLEQLGGFDEEFFLYCEDTDLGLRAQWAGWRCEYVPAAVVDHRYSESAGRVSTLKAYYVERNRLAVAVKNFPWRMLAAAPLLAMSRYGWHVLTVISGSGPAGQFRREGGSAALLGWFVLRAHVSVLWRLRGLLRARRAIRRAAAITPRQFVALAHRHSISAQEVATL